MQAPITKPTGQPELYPVPAVGAVCLRGEEVLLIRRGRPPHQGEWSIPGGKVNRGESLYDAVLRELFEETGVRGEISHMVEVYEIIEPDHHYVLIDYAVQWISGEPVAGDDAAEARFMPRVQALKTVTRQDLVDVLLKAFG